MAAQTEEDTQSFKVLRRIEVGKYPTHSVRLLASEFYYVYEGDGILDLADDFRSDEEILAVGVLDSQDRVVGAIVRTDFFARLSRPFALDLYQRRQIREITGEIDRISGDETVFTVAELIDAQLRDPSTTFYVLVGENEKFLGLFSTHDMLVYLSDITQADIGLARSLQSRIVREHDLVVGSQFEFASASHPAKGVGGDFYSIREYAEGRWIIGLCDVSGKGVAASILTSALWGMMSIYDFRRGLRGFLNELNRYILTTFEAEKFITAVFLDYDEANRTVRVCDLGHSHLFLCRDGKFGKLKNKHGNLPLGIVAEIEPKLNLFHPQEHDILLLLTDGLIEQPDRSGEEYSIERVAGVVASLSEAPVESISHAIVRDFRSFRGNRHLHDDMTFGIMRFAEQEVTLSEGRS
jgi:sigma-B regulation protein RsbU (phosphoserine phosphatase)